MTKKKIDHKTILYSLSYLLYEYSKRFVRPVVQPVVQRAAKCKRTLTVACVKTPADQTRDVYIDVAVPSVSAGT